MDPSKQPIEYRKVLFRPNFTSIHGTGAKLKSQLGWNLHLPGYGSLNWEPSLKQAKASVDYLWDQERAPAIAKALGLPAAT